MRLVRVPDDVPRDERTVEVVWVALATYRTTFPEGELLEAWGADDDVLDPAALEGIASGELNVALADAEARLLPTVSERSVAEARFVPGPDTGDDGAAVQLDVPVARWLLHLVADEVRRSASAVDAAERAAALGLAAATPPSHAAAVERLELAQQAMAGLALALGLGELAAVLAPVAAARPGPVTVGRPW